MGHSHEQTALVVSGVLFAASAFWKLRWAKDKEKTGSRNVRVSMHEISLVGRRGADALTPPLPYLDGFLSALEYLCDPITTPDGYVPLCVAENKLAVDVLSERLINSGAITSAFSDHEVYGYNSFLGLPVARRAVAYFLAKRFYRPDIPSLGIDQALALIHPEHVAITSGASAGLHSLFYLLGDKGDACLIPAPYYAAFRNDMGLVAGIVPFSVELANPAMGPSESDLETAYKKARSQGLNPKFVLITNPANPLGVIYSPEVIRNAIGWARRRTLHTIMDEVYALETHTKYDHNFQSVMRILDNNLGTDVHFVWSLSKDFGASGLRAGVIYSQNAPFFEGLANLNIFACVSSPIQMVMAQLLTDDDFVDSYLDTARERLHESYLICVEKLEEMVIPFVPVDAAMFVYVDFSSLLPEKTFEYEEKLGKIMCDYGRLILTPGSSQEERTPGMFRICYAWVPPDVLRIGMERLSRIVAKLRKMDWADLTDDTMSAIIM